MTDTRMQTITKYPHGAFSWIELGTSDQEAAKRFYTELFGWSYRDDPIGDDAVYTMLHLDGKPVAGLYRVPPEMGIPPRWTSYIAVENVDTTTAQVDPLGGSVIEQPFDVGEFGRMSLLQDPTGAPVCLWQARSHIGSSFYQRPGAFCWNELYTRDVAAAADFYTKLLGWTAGLDRFNGVQYAACNNGEAPVAVIMPIGAEMGDMPPSWLIYLGVETVDGSAAKAQELGGTVLAGPTEHGGFRYALVQDPQGARFFLIAS
ncbi:MAG: VOC family protein [Caldilineaceae bacterium]|nr:VOC family protein [Caldilineaceae bacterium]